MAVLSAAITCASLALADAGIEMYDLVIGTTAVSGEGLALLGCSGFYNFRVPLLFTNTISSRGAPEVCVILFDISPHEAPEVCVTLFNISPHEAPEVCVTLFDILPCGAPLTFYLVEHLKPKPQYLLFHPTEPSWFFRLHFLQSSLSIEHCVAWSVTQTFALWFDFTVDWALQCDFADQAFKCLSSHICPDLIVMVD